MIGGKGGKPRERRKILGEVNISIYQPALFKQEGGFEQAIGNIKKSQKAASLSLRTQEPTVRPRLGSHPSPAPSPGGHWSKGSGGRGRGGACSWLPALWMSALAFWRTGIRLHRVASDLSVPPATSRQQRGQCRQLPTGLCAGRDATNLGRNTSQETVSHFSHKIEFK